MAIATLSFVTVSGSLFVALQLGELGPLVVAVAMTVATVIITVLRGVDGFGIAAGIASAVLFATHVWGVDILIALTMTVVLEVIQTFVSAMEQIEISN